MLSELPCRPCSQVLPTINSHKIEYIPEEAVSHFLYASSILTELANYNRKKWKRASTLKSEWTASDKEQVCDWFQLGVGLLDLRQH